MVRWVVFVALVVSSLACAGCGINWGDPSACYGDPSDPFSCPPTPAPPLASVGGAAPSYVATPPPGYAGVHTSSNLPLVATWPTTIVLVDTRPNGVCPTLTLATLNPQSLLRAPRSGAVYSRTLR